MSHSQAASATAASLTVHELVRSRLAARGHPCRDDPGSVPAGSSAAYPISAQAHAAWSHRVPTPTARRLPVHREQRAASAPDDPHLRPHYETVKPALRDLPHWGAGGEIDGPAVSIGRQRLFSPSATSLGLATLELEVPRLLVEGQVNVGWPRPPRSRMASPPASTSPTSWSSLGGLPLVAAVARHLGVDEPAQEGPASR
jgi:hypothetical protein